MFGCAHSGIEVELEKEFPEAIKFTMDAWAHLKKLDYDQIQFKCKGSHEYGNFSINCAKTHPIPRNNEMEKGWW